MQVGLFPIGCVVVLSSSLSTVMSSSSLTVAPKDLYGNNAFAVNVPTVRLSNWILNG